MGEGRRGGGGGGGRGLGQAAMADPEEERLGLEPEDSGGMDPDHPLLARAQAALKAQLVTARENVEAELRAKHESLRVRDLSGDARRCARLADHFQNINYIINYISVGQTKNSAPSSRTIFKIS